jgi:hypothetical protein
MRFDTYMFSVTVSILNKFKMTFVQQLLLVYWILLCVCIDLFLRYMKELLSLLLYIYNAISYEFNTPCTC